MQNKNQEIAFFDKYANNEGEYNVFTDQSNQKIVQNCIEFGGFKPDMQIVDLGCGAGIFTKILHELGFQVVGLDISSGLIKVAQGQFPQIEFVVGDVEELPFESQSLDGIFLSGILHHLPDPSKCAQEVYRVLKAPGIFVAFDPNRRNPFMWLYRDKSSPFYSSQGVTENERPLLAEEIVPVFNQVGFQVSTRYLSGLHYRYIASSALRWALPIYNRLDDILFRPSLLQSRRAFILTRGVKPSQ